MSKLYPAIMVDIETLSSEPDAPVIQIGLAAFDIRTGELGPTKSILVRPDLRKSPASLSTVVWWMQQDQAARDSVSRCEKEGFGPDGALNIMDTFFRDHGEPKCEVWAMPPEFDLTILTNMGRLSDHKMPWAYNKSRDLRTLEALAGCTSVDRVKAVVAHDAAEDAKAQALTAIQYYRKVFA